MQGRATPLGLLLPKENWDLSTFHRFSQGISPQVKVLLHALKPQDLPSAAWQEFSVQGHSVK